MKSVEYRVVMSKPPGEHNAETSTEEFPTRVVEGEHGETAELLSVGRKAKSSV